MKFSYKPALKYSEYFDYGYLQAQEMICKYEFSQEFIVEIRKYMNIPILQ